MATSLKAPGGQPARTIVVTGASSGIGAATCALLYQRGFRVIGAARYGDGGQQAAFTDPFESIRLDLTSHESIARFAESLQSRVADGGLFGLVNNAGLAIAGPIECMPLVQLRRQMEVNLFGWIDLTQRLLPMLREARGRIINVGSDNAILAMPYLGGYCASKFAADAATDSLRLEAAVHGVRVSIVHPGCIDTALWPKAIKDSRCIEAAYPEQMKQLYGPAMNTMERAARKMHSRSIPAHRVAETIARALTVRNPRSRYLVGWDARLVDAMRRFLPRFATDYILKILLK